MASSSAHLVSSIETSVRPRHRIPSVNFEMLVLLPDSDAEVLECLVLPKLFLNKLKPKSTIVSLVDYEKHQFEVLVDRLPSGYLKIHAKDWGQFVSLHVLGDQRCRSICFRMLSPNVFEVFCFNQNGQEFSHTEAGNLLMKRCLVCSTPATFSRQILPILLLDDLNKRILGKQQLFASLSGPRHAAEVLVIFQYDALIHGVRKCHAVGFEGSQWTMFLIENYVEENSTLMITNLRNGCYQVSVFNPNGLSVGYNSFKEDGMDNYLEGLSDSTDDSDGEFDHQCSVVGHNHRRGKYCFTCKLPDLILTRKILTIPSAFVEKHSLYLYREAKLFYGNVRFKVMLERRFDRRRPDHLNHVVMKGNWMKFLKDSGLVVGDTVRFKLSVGRSVPDEAAVFRIC